MRISADISDPGYSADSAYLASAKVFLDGVEQDLVVTADDEEGAILVAVANKDGNVQVNPEKPDEVWTEWRRGKVEIRFP